MTKELVEQLKDYGDYGAQRAADAFEAQAARIKVLEEALRQISMACDTYGEDLSFGDMCTVKRIQDYARAALKGDTP